MPSSSSSKRVLLPSIVGVVFVISHLTGYTKDISNYLSASITNVIATTNNNNNLRTNRRADVDDESLVEDLGQKENRDDLRTATPSSSSSSAATEIPTSKQPPSRYQSKEVRLSFDYNDLDVFEQHGCFPVKHICTTGKEWFYSDRRKGPHAYQPSFTLMHGLHVEGLPNQIRVDNSLFYDTDILKKKKSVKDPICHASPIPNHIVFTGSFLSMAMEVYFRIVVGMWKLWDDISSSSWWKESPSSPYIQFHSLTIADQAEVEKKVISSMSPLLAGFTSNPVQNYINLLKPGLGCQCFDTLIFCGFQEDTATTAADPPAVRHLKNGAMIGTQSERIDPGYDNIRAHIRQGALHVYQNATTLAKAFKLGTIIESLEQMGESYNHHEILDHIHEWTMIGFSQRSGNRRWLNLNQTLDLCRQEWLLPHKVVCVEINLDTPEGADPANQVIMHAGLDALIGIHGSQFVHSVWMPDGAYTLEILPHLIGAWGEWTQTTHQPTCNGGILTDAKLNHLGYGLNETSVPNCTSAEWKYATNCNDEVAWVNRDVLIPPEMIHSFIQKFLLLPSGGTVTTTAPRKCTDYDKLANLEFVLYNVNCVEDGETIRGSDGHNNNITQKHYYRERTSFSHLDKL